jgi:hypothetical protein
MALLPLESLRQLLPDILTRTAFYKLICKSICKFKNDLSNKPIPSPATFSADSRKPAAVHIFQKSRAQLRTRLYIN